jgi:hypothetical protein
MLADEGFVQIRSHLLREGYGNSHNHQVWRQPIYSPLDLSGQYRLNLSVHFLPCLLVLLGSQNLNQGTALAQNIQISPKGKKPLWSEKPTSAQINISNATAQGPGTKLTETQTINQNQVTQVTTNVVTPPTTESQQSSTQNVISNQVLKFTQYYQATPQKPNELYQLLSISSWQVMSLLRFISD